MSSDIKEILPPPLRGTVATPVPIPKERLQEKDSVATERSFAVTIVALYELLRGAVVFFVVYNLWGAEEADLTANNNLRLLIYLVTRRNIWGHHVPIASFITIFSLLAAYYTVTGLGLLLMQGWARKAAMFMSGMAIFRLLWYFIAAQAIGAEAVLSGQQQAYLLVLLFLDVFVLGALVNQSHAFTEHG